MSTRPDKLILTNESPKSERILLEANDKSLTLTVLNNSNTESLCLLFSDGAGDNDNECKDVDNIVTFTLDDKWSGIEIKAKSSSDTFSIEFSLLFNK